MSTTDELVQERHDAVLVARLNRPDARNALNGAMLRGISDAVTTAEDDPEVRALVLIGTGDRAFCAGMDLAAFAADDDTGIDDPDTTRGFFRLIQGEVAVPVVGAANATAVAGGFELLLGCDVIVASSEAEFGLPEVKRGLFPAGGGTFLGTRVPLGIALEMTLTGDRISAARAYELGLINTVVAPSEVLGAALDLAERMAANGPLALKAVKELVRLGVTDHALARARVTEWQDVIFSSEDAKEGATAFIEKRAPEWRGR
ncbi:MAG: enoyl-CoA hydratase [Actinobacteria bacterium]|nr:enoyl-CoA hydratase [Actinomycetota bacterium]